MTHDDEKRDQERERDAGGPQRPQDAPVRQPEPEEVPELLGERSDYPIPFGEGDRER